MSYISKESNRLGELLLDFDCKQPILMCSLASEVCRARAALTF